MAMSLTAAMKKDEEFEEMQRKMSVVLDWIKGQKGGEKVLHLKPGDIQPSA